MAKSDFLENGILDLIYTAVSISGIADDTATSAETTISVALHTASPGDGGTQSTNEVAYTGYSRVTVARTTGGWTVTGDTVENANAITFGACTAGSATASHFSTGKADGTILHHGALDAPLSISAGITPEFAAGALTITEA